MSLLELTDFVERLSSDQKVKFFYKVQGSGTLGSFEMLENDMDVFRMVSDGLRYRDVEMFMVVPPKPLKIDFIYAANKPIQLSDDEDDMDDKQGCDYHSMGNNDQYTDFEFASEGREPEVEHEVDLEVEADDEAEVEEEVVSEAEPEVEETTTKLSGRMMK